jgi:hypothetical protein
LFLTPFWVYGFFSSVFKGAICGKVTW